MTQENPGTQAEMSDEQFREHALDILRRELGASGFDRFLRVYGTGDYTLDRHLWLEHLTVEQIVADIREQRQASA
jgi:hypothetical protein